MAILTITSTQNPRVKYLVKLRNHRQRQEEKKVLVEGYREVTRALQQSFQFEEFYFCRDLFLGDNENELLEKLSEDGVSLIECSVDVFQKISYRDRPEGLLGVMPFWDTSLKKLPLVEKGFYLVVEAIEKPGNLGTILRTADGVGVNGVIVSNRCTDLFNPNVLRASTGAIFSVPIAEASTEEVVEWLTSNGIESVAADPYADNIYYKKSYLGPMAIILGSEQHGLSKVWKEHSNCLVKIPMKGMADSLNVAQAGTVLMFEVLRQRSLEM